MPCYRYITKFWCRYSKLYDGISQPNRKKTEACRCDTDKVLLVSNSVVWTVKQEKTEACRHDTDKVSVVTDSQTGKRVKLVVTILTKSRLSPGQWGGAPPGIDPQVAQWFQTVDTDRSGRITARELQQALVNANWSQFNQETCRLMIGNSLFRGAAHVYVPVLVCLFVCLLYLLENHMNMYWCLFAQVSLCLLIIYLLMLICPFINLILVIIL